MQKVSSVLLMLTTSVCFSQARLVLNNDAHLVMGANTTVVLQNGNANALTLSGTGGNIISENESAVLKWNTGNNTGIYVVPFTTLAAVNGGNGTKIPLQLTIVNPGDAGGELQFATYETSTDMNIPWATDVTHMNNNSGTDNTLLVADRFWIIDPAAYTTLPDVDITFQYDPALNELGGSNTIAEANLIAQRFNNNFGIWGDYTSGTANVISHQVENVTVGAADFFRTWVLVDNSSPLPIELLSVSSVCSSGNATLLWSTASETNSHYFAIEYSTDNVSWHSAGTVDAAGNSSGIRNYSYTITQAVQQNLFIRLWQYDFDGTANFCGISALECNADAVGVTLFPNPAREIAYIQFSEVWLGGSLKLHNSVGQLVYSSNITSQTQPLPVQTLATGVYYINIQNGDLQHNLKFARN
jgi:hypothetical protein